MNRKLLVGGGIAVLLLTVAFFLLRSYTKSFSPEAVASYKERGFSIEVNYCQPSKKGRLIFGPENSDALVPYGKVWRTGANEATILRLGTGVTLAGTAVKSGNYSLWTIPGPNGWELILNEEIGQWGTQYNDGKDLLRAKIATRPLPEVVESFTIRFEEQADGVDMLLSWDQTEAIVPFRL